MVEKEKEEEQEREEQETEEEEEEKEEDDLRSHLSLRSQKRSVNQIKGRSVQRS